MNSLEHFNQFYSMGGSNPAPKSLLEFFRSCVRERMPSDGEILDLGSGAYSIFEDLNLEKEKITAIDFSPVAISKAEARHSGINYKTLDLTFPDALEGKVFDLIFDSHCLHCIENVAGRVSAFKNIYDSLSENGIFATEMMVQPAHKSVHFPMKYIPSARSLEEEFASHGLKIIYFMIGRGLSFENGNEECDLVRIIARK